MDNLESRPPESSHSPNQEAGHERSDVQIKPIVIFLAVLTIVVLICFGSLVLMWNVLEARWEAADSRPSPLLESQQLPPEPRLQVSPRIELEELNAGSEALLHGYAWIDRDAGVVRIPIERAMELLEERGLKSRTPEPAGQGH